MDQSNQWLSVTSDETLTTFLHLKAVPGNTVRGYDDLISTNQKVPLHFRYCTSIISVQCARVSLLSRLYG